MAKKRVTRRKRSRKASETFSATARDVTGRKQIDERLRSSEKHYMELAESISDVFFAMDSNLRYTYWNKASENLTVISAKDAIGKPIFDVFPDNEDTRRAVAMYREVLKTRQHKSFINEYRLGDKNFVFEISVNPTENGISNFTRDITERKRADEELRELEEKLRNLVKNASVGMIISCADKHVTDVNDALLKMHGCDSKEEFVRWPAE